MQGEKIGLSRRIITSNFYPVKRVFRPHKTCIYHQNDEQIWF